jgi:transglutaminase-like putative cysteine protease
MNRVRPVEAALAALATLAVTLPLTTLFTPSAAWFRPSFLLVALVALAGMGLRRVTASRPLVVLGQATGLVLGAALLHGQGHLWRDLVPTPETGRAFGVLLGEAYRTVTDYTAPAPANRGTVLAVSVLIGVTALAVDAIGVTYRSPALAGIPLLSAFLGSATNSGDGLGAWYAVPPALCWLALVGRQGVRSVRSWGAATPRSSSGRLADPTSSFATMGRVVGAAALGVAVVVPTLVPHFPTTFLADGLGRSTDGRGVGGSDLRLTSSIDIARDLGSRSTDPVLRYRSTSDRLQPLRVGILDSYRRGRWESRSDFTFVPVDGRIPGPSAGPEVPRRVEQITVLENGLGVPQVALPEGTTGSPFPAGTWNITAEGLVQVTQPIESYTAEYVELDPDASQFDAGSGSRPGDDENLALDPGSESEVRRLLAELTDEGDTPLEAARAIQAYLRGPLFTYSLDLADETADGSLPEEPLVRFLQTRRGYCVQFTSAMIMLSRAAGIPARMAVGFLPGVPDEEDRVVRANDAHAWPELWFPRLGWVRFEPTPGTRSGVAPNYTVVPTDTGAGPSPSPSSTASAPSSIPSTGPERDVTDEGLQTTDGSPVSGVTRYVSDHVATIAVLLLAALAVAVLPLGAWLARRRARRQALDDAERVEAEWQSLLLRLQDIGFVPPDGATPRQTSRRIGQAAYLTPDESQALGRVVSTLELARYARPGSDLDDVADDARTVWRGALSRRRRSDRVRALLLPEEGRQHWRAAMRRLVPWPARSGRSDAPGDD